ncbi:MAG: phosphate acyltransferase PlsX [Acidobacteria bacterium]|nr:phosphate acyltransferase PlsX [Acidobacteriota bacterium]
MTVTDPSHPDALLPIAVDAMGGDHAPRETVLGALAAASLDHTPVILVGRAEEINRELAAAGREVPSNLEIFDAREAITMEDTSIRAVLKKKDSSLHVCARLVQEGRAAAMLSAGNTAAVWTIARRAIGMVEGVERPALAAVLPRQEGQTILLDVGANVDSHPHHLREFAVMGHFYAQMITGIENPRLGLLSIGEEEGKGNALTRESSSVLKAAGLNFLGNAEGRDIFNGKFDVVVTDGFIGNVVLKASESLASMITKTLRKEMMRSWRGKLGGFLAKPVFANIKKRIDPSEVGGAPLLGIKGGCVICHGRSNQKAIRNAIRVARNFVETGMNQKIYEKIMELHKREAAEGLVEE